jgi:hypothetical protein
VLRNKNSIFMFENVLWVIEEKIFVKN